MFFIFTFSRRQESGRAGRDGKQAWARIYHSVKERDAQTFLINMEINRAKTEGVKRQKQAAMKSFNVMVKYCESVSCRHALFSRHFGDTPPVCKDRCDACSDRKAAEAKLESFSISMDTRLAKGFRTVSKLDSDSSEMYGEGRRGQKREADSYFGEDYEGGDGGKSREKAAKEERENAIKRQFKMRKKGGEKEADKSKGKMGLGHARVRAAEFTETKVAGLDLKTRESYYDLLVAALTTNYEAALSFRTKEMSLGEIGDAGVEAEYNIFTSNKTTTMYRSKLANLIQRVKKETKELLFSSLLESFTPLKENSKSLASLATEVKEQMAEEKKVKEKKTGGFRLKREKGKQQTIGNFFQPSSGKPASPVRDFSPGSLTMADHHDEEMNSQSSSARDSPEGLPCPLCMTEFPLDKIESHAAICDVGEQVGNKGSTLHAMSDSEEEDEGNNLTGNPDPHLGANGTEESEDMASSSAFLDTRRKWQERMDRRTIEDPSNSNSEKPSPDQRPNDDGSPHESDPFVETDPFVGSETLSNGDASHEGNFSVASTEERDGKDMSSVEGSGLDVVADKEEQSNLSKLLAEIGKNIEAENAKKEQEEKARQREKREQLKRGKETEFASRSSKSTLHTKENGESSKRTLDEKNCSKINNHQGNGEQLGSKRRAEDLKVTESRKRLQSKLSIKRQEMIGSSRSNGNTHEKGGPLDTSLRSSGSETSLAHDPKEKKKVADVFVAYLTPYLKSERIESKQAFKILARDLTHMVVSSGIEMTRERVKNTVASFFKVNTDTVREDTVKALVAGFQI